MKYLNERQWWPFEVVVPVERRSGEASVKLAFLEEASKHGAKSFMQNNDIECGAVASNGRECLIVLRGKQRAELLLTDGDELAVKRPYNGPNDFEAFRQAATDGLAWITGENRNHQGDAALSEQSCLPPSSKINNNGS